MALSTGKKAFDQEKPLKESEEITQKIIDYMKDDAVRRWEFRSLADLKYYYTDEAYWWSDQTIEDIKNSVYGFADGFVEHVLKKMENETNGKG